MLPQRSAMLPQRSRMLLQRSAVLLERSGEQDERSVALPQRYTALRERSAVLHKRSAYAVRCPVPESPISTLPPGKYSFHRRVTVAAVSSSAKSSLGNQGFMRASIRTGGL